MINWNVDPILVQLGPLAFRWYGLLFAAGFLLGYRIMSGYFAREKISLKHLDKLLIYTAVGTILGARLGHTLFYEPEIYLRQPLRILMIWEGGLASHGAALGILLSTWIFCKKYSRGYIWLLDRVVVTVALAGGLIRLGNLFNSEIIGRPTDGNWGVIFQRYDGLPRHPAQLYESIAYFAIFAVLYFSFKNPGLRKRTGLSLGLFLGLVFSARFFLEFVKEAQVEFERVMPLNMGQLLSTPFVLIGFYLVFKSLKRQT